MPTEFSSSSDEELNRALRRNNRGRRRQTRRDERCITTVIEPPTNPVVFNDQIIMPRAGTVYCPSRRHYFKLVSVQAAPGLVFGAPQLRIWQRHAAEEKNTDQRLVLDPRTGKNIDLSAADPQGFYIAVFEKSHDEKELKLLDNLLGTPTMKDRKLLAGWDSFSSRRASCWLGPSAPLMLYRACECNQWPDLADQLCVMVWTTNDQLCQTSYCRLNNGSYAATHYVLQREGLELSQVNWYPQRGLRMRGTFMFLGTSARKQHRKDGDDSVVHIDFFRSEENSLIAVNGFPVQVCDNRALITEVPLVSLVNSSSDCCSVWVTSGRMLSRVDIPLNGIGTATVISFRFGTVCLSSAVTALHLFDWNTALDADVLSLPEDAVQLLCGLCSGVVNVVMDFVGSVRSEAAKTKGKILAHCVCHNNARVVGLYSNIPGLNKYFFVSCASDGGIKVWDLRTFCAAAVPVVILRETTQVRETIGAVYAFSGSYICVAGCGSSTVEVIDSAQHAVVHRISLSKPCSIRMTIACVCERHGYFPGCLLVATHCDGDIQCNLVQLSFSPR